MKVNELTPEPRDKVLFKISSYKLVPQENGCYVLTNFENEILYIGLAKNINNRFKQHLENPEKTNPTKEGKAIWFYFKVFDPKNLEKLERSLLNQFANIQGRRPILNKKDSPIH